MTTTALLPSPTTPTLPSRFGRAYRGTGYARTGLPVASVRTTDDGEQHLLVPVEDVVAVEAHLRATASFSVRTTGPDALRDVVTRTADHVAQAHALTGELRLEIRSQAPAGALGLLEAAAAATVQALCKVGELTLTAHTRADAVRAIIPDALGLIYGCPGVFAAGGRAVHLVHDHGRLLVVTLTPPVPDLTRPGRLTDPVGDLSDSHRFARWLATCSGTAVSAAAQAAAELAGPNVLAIVGGQGEEAPVAVLLDGDTSNMPTTQELSRALSTALAPLAGPDGPWRVRMARTVAPSAEL